MSTANFHTMEHILPCQHIRHYPRATVHGDDDDLHIVIKQYTPRDNPHPQPGDVTIIAAHANGVGKELYEPLWDELYTLTKTSTAFRIRGIWMADVAMQGASGVLNETKLGNDPSWYDHPRDLLHMINHFRRSMPRPLVGVGHSMGGNNIVNLSLMHPRLLHSVILIDPVIQRTVTAKGNYSPAYLSTFRRDVWLSRAEAEAGMRWNKFYQRWDPRVLDLWLEHGLRELPTELYPDYTPTTSKPSRAAALVSAAASSTAVPVPPASPTDKPVTLTTTKHQEVFTFLRPNYPAPGTPLSSYTAPRRTHPDVPPLASPTGPFYRPEPLLTFNSLPTLRPHCLYVFAAESDLSAPDARADKLSYTGTGVGGSGGQAEGAVVDVVVQGAGHFVPFEKPTEVAGHVAVWLEKQAVRWAEEEETERREWAAVPVVEKAKVSRAWEYWMRGDVKGMVDREKVREEECSRLQSDVKARGPKL